MLVERREPYSIFEIMSNTFLICTGWTRRERRSGRRRNPRRGGAGGRTRKPCTNYFNRRSFNRRSFLSQI